MKLIRFHADIEQYLSDIKGPQRELVRKLSSILLSEDPPVTERLGRSGLSFYCLSKEKKLRKSDYLSIVRYKDCVLLIFPVAHRYSDEQNILEGHFEDGRKLVLFRDLKEFQEKKPAVRVLIDRWLSLLTTGQP